MRQRGARETLEAELVDYARLQVRAGLLCAEEMREDVAEAIAAEMPGVDADVLARAWLARAIADLRADQASWTTPTDHDRLQAAFAECHEHGVPVLQGVADHWAATSELDRLAAAGRAPRGILWFTAPDVWHAIDEGMLEVNLWHGDKANAAPGDPLLEAVVACLARHGLTAHFDEGRIEVIAHWRRPA